MTRWDFHSSVSFCQESYKSKLKLIGLMTHSQKFVYSENMSLIGLMTHFQKFVYSEKMSNVSVFQWGNIKNVSRR